MFLTAICSYFTLVTLLAQQIHTTQCTTYVLVLLGLGSVWYPRGTTTGLSLLAAIFSFLLKMRPIDVLRPPLFFLGAGGLWSESWLELVLLWELGVLLEPSPPPDLPVTRQQTESTFHYESLDIKTDIPPCRSLGLLLKTTEPSNTTTKKTLGYQWKHTECSTNKLVYKW